MSAIGATDLDDDYRSSCIEILEYIPLVSTIVGLARAIFGLAETLIGLLTLPFELASRSIEHKKPLMVIDGLANIARGLIAAKPIIGNVILYVYDHSSATKRDIRKGIGLE